MWSRARSPRRVDRSLGPVREVHAIVTQLHTWLALASALVIVLVGVEAGWRAWRRLPPGDVTDQLEGILLLVLVVAIAGGLGLLVGGAHPRELLHFVYAIVLLSVLPIAGTLTKEASPRARGLAHVTGALVALVVVARLFGTG